MEQGRFSIRDYKDIEDLRLHIAEFIERYYNQKRLHSALGYLSAAEFERTTASSDVASIADMAQLKI